jgi:glyoxylase I family protein
MERVTGIGGVFFRAQDPAALSAWYAEHLGIAPPPDSYGGEVWVQQAGPTAFAPMPEDSEMVRPALSINFRVSDLDAMRAQLESAGIAVEVDPEQYPIGRFATVLDPEGNQIQLWEVAGE